MSLGHRMNSSLALENLLTWHKQFSLHICDYGFPMLINHFNLKEIMRMFFHMYYPVLQIHLSFHLSRESTVGFGIHRIQQFWLSFENGCGCCHGNIITILLDVIIMVIRPSALNIICQNFHYRISMYVFVSCLKIV